jgi:hypothetical protein
MDKEELMSKLLPLTPDALVLVEMVKSDQFDAYDFGKILGRILMRLLDWTLSTSKPEYTEQFSTKFNIFITIAELIDQPQLKKIVPLLINLDKIFDNLTLISEGGVMLTYRVLALVKSTRALYENLKELSEEFDWLKKPIEPILARLNEFCTGTLSSENWSWIRSALQTSLDKLGEMGTAATSSENWSWLNSALQWALGKLGEIVTAATSSKNWSWLNSALQWALGKLGEIVTAATSSENWSWLNSALQWALGKLGEIVTAATSSKNWSWLNSALQWALDKLGEIVNRI